jgi:hypothetical protein
VRRNLSGSHACGLAALFLLSSAVTPSRLWSQQTLNDDASAVESATFLLVPVGARAVGMSGAVVASADQWESVFWNPAGVGSLARGAVYFMHSNDFGSDSNILGLIWRLDRLRLGAAFYAFDLGTLQATDEAGAALGTLEVGNREFVVTAAAPVLGWLDLGANAKLVQFASSCAGACTNLAFTSTSFLFDLGAVVVVPSFPALRLGLALTNAGAGLDLAGSGVTDPPPTRLRLGAAFDVLAGFDPGGNPDAPLDLALAADFQEPWAEFDDLQAFLGTEIGFRKILYVRAGYAWAGVGRSGASLGLGVNVMRFRFSLGRSFDDFSTFDSDEPFQFSLGFDL